MAESKETFVTEIYLNKLDIYRARLLFQFRTRNHRLPVEKSRWNKYKNIPNSDQCNLCSQDRGDEFHILMHCKALSSTRKQYLPRRYYDRPNILKYRQLMQTSNVKNLRKFCSFVKIILQL